MLNLYQMNTLIVTEITEYSVYAEGGGHEPMPLRDAPDGIKVADTVEAFVYLDAENNLAATMAQSYAQVGECAYLEVVSSSDRGTFLNWGLPKDLLVPFSEQIMAVSEGDFCFVYVYLDTMQRPIASMKLHKHLNEDAADLEVNQAVELQIADESELGFKAVINNKQLGLIYHDELARPLEIGSTMKGWVKKIRPDGKINLTINKLDEETRDQLEATILDRLKSNGGRLDISDKSSPDVIFEAFKVSKKNFKRALGSLYSSRVINITPEFIELTSK